jgi:hypothetical protein
MSFALFRYALFVIYFRCDNNININNNNNNNNLKFGQYTLDNRDLIMVNGKYYGNFLYYELENQ